MNFSDLIATQLDELPLAEFGTFEQWALDEAMKRCGMTKYPTVKGNPDGERVSGNCVCELCGNEYRLHPLDWRVIGYGNVPFLNVLCDGQRVKL